MTPDKGFRKQLHMLDPELEVLWDWGSAKWEIWKFPKDGKKEQHIMTVQTKDKSYRELGADVLLKLQMGDTHRFSTKQLIDYFDELDNQVIRRKEKELKDRVEAMVKDTVPFLYRLMGKPIKIKVPKNVKARRVIANAYA